MPDVSAAVSPAVSAADYARIYEEQQPRLVAYARSLTRNAHTAEDLVAEAHFRVWRRLAAGHEIDNVPAYLMTTLRHLASAAGSAVRETPLDPQASGGEQVEAGRHGDDPAEQVSSVDMVVRVLGQLPERWVKALWLAEAEGQPLAAIGPQLGTKEGATAVLLHRAREGMRQAFLKEQTGAPDDPACQVHWARMPAYVRGAASSRQSERLLGHVDACDDCRVRLAALMSANDRLPAMVGPALLVFAVGGGAGKFLLTFAGTSTAFSGGGGGGLFDGVRHASVGGSKAAAAAGAVVVGAAAVFLVLGPDSGSIPAQRRPVAEAPAAQVPVAEAPVERAPDEGGGTSEGAAGVQRATQDTRTVVVADGGGGTVTVVGVRNSGESVSGSGSSSGSGSGEGDAEEAGGTPSSPAEPAPAEPAPTDPAPAQPAPTDPAPTEPAPAEPGGNAPETPAAPVEDSPKTPEPPADEPPQAPVTPVEESPESPAPPADEPSQTPEAPADDTPEAETPSTPSPEPAPDEPSTDDPAPAPSTPAEPQPEPTEPSVPAHPGDDCGGPQGNTGHAEK